MVWIVAFLYAVAAVLPVAGVVRLFGTAKREALMIEQSPGASAGASIGQVNTAMPILVDSIRNRPKQVRLDFWLIGGGVIFGAVASIWSLFLP